MDEADWNRLADERFLGVVRLDAIDTPTWVTDGLVDWVDNFMDYEVARLAIDSRGVMIGRPKGGPPDMWMVVSAGPLLGDPDSELESLLDWLGIPRAAIVQRGWGQQ